MEAEEGRCRRRRRGCLLAVALVFCSLLLLTVVVVVCVTTAARRTSMMYVFLARCEFKLPGHDCENLWKTFQKAFLGRDPCTVQPDDYSQLLAMAPAISHCNTMIFWSKTKAAVQSFANRGECFFTLEDTPLGYILDGLYWCGKMGSQEIFTSHCPDCQPNPVHSFWIKASEAYADLACGNISVMLNGSIETPFSSSSVFGSTEIKRFQPPRVASLTAVLVTEGPALASCSNPSMKQLERELDKGIKYNCLEKSLSKIQECYAQPGACRKCW